PCGHVPEDDPLAIDRSHLPAVGREGERAPGGFGPVRGPAVLPQQTKFLTRARIPQADGAFRVVPPPLRKVPGRQGLAVRGKGRAAELAECERERLHLLSGGKIPAQQTYLLALAGGQRLAVRREGEPVNRAAVPARRADFLARGHVPKPGGALRER